MTTILVATAPLLAHPAPAAAPCILTVIPYRTRFVKSSYAIYTSIFRETWSKPAYKSKPRYIVGSNPSGPLPSRDGKKLIEEVINAQGSQVCCSQS